MTTRILIILVVTYPLTIWIRAVLGIYNKIDKSYTVSAFLLSGIGHVQRIASVLQDGLAHGIVVFEAGP
jgi:hypothetical protein